MVWWFIHFRASVPDLPRYVGPFSNKELAQLFVRKRTVEADCEFLPIVTPSEFSEPSE